MYCKFFKLFSIAFLSASVLACSDESKFELPKLSKPVISDVVYDGMLKLPGSIDSLGVILIGEITTELVDSLSTDSLLLYFNFTGKSSGLYANMGDTMSVDIMQFTHANDAYGYYAHFRKDDTKLQSYLAESYAESGQIYFVYGAYVVKISFDEFEKNKIEKVKPFADVIVSQIDAPPKIPSYFIMFPFNRKIVPSGKFIPYNYLGIGGLNKVFTTDYLPETNQVKFTLFLMRDESGKKYNNLLAFAKNSEVNGGSVVVEDPKGFEFDRGIGLAFEHPEYGLIVAGLVRNQLVGVIGFDPNLNGKFANTWFKGLK